jgi:O-antigen/teichoic acid export membrane protein
MEKNKSITRNVIFKVLLSTFNILVPLIIGPYAYRVIGDNNMGMINHADAIYNYFYIFATFGIYQYGLREMSRIRNDKEKLKTVFTSLFVIGVIANIVVLSIFIMFTNAKYGGTVKYPVLMLYSINIFANVFYIEWANEALENYDFIAIKTIIVRIIYLVCLFAFVRTEKDYIIYTVIINAYTLINYFVSFIYIKKRIGFSFKNLNLSIHVKYLLMSLIMGNANMLYIQLDRVMLGDYVSDRSVAYYTLSSYITSMLNTLILSVVYVTIPRLANIVAKDDEEGYHNLLNKVCENLFAFIFPAAIGIFVTAREIVLIYGGAKYIDTVPVLKGFTLFMITSAFESVFTNQILYVKRKEKRLVLFILGAGLMNLFFNITLVRLGIFSAVTAIYTTALANFILISMEFIYAVFVLKVKINLFTMEKLKYLLYSILFIPITLGIRMVTNRVVPVFLLAVTINVLYYVGVLYLTKDKVLLAFINKFFKKAGKA